MSDNSHQPRFMSRILLGLAIVPALVGLVSLYGSHSASGPVGEEELQGSAESAPSEPTIPPNPGSFIDAAWDGNLETIKGMLAAGISPDTANERGTSALSIAVGKGYNDVANTLLNAGVSQETKNSALGSAAAIGQLEIVSLLLDRGADPRAVNPGIFGGQKPVLLSAAEFGTSEKVKALLAAGATWDQLSEEQLNEALISASCAGWAFTVEELLGAGANPNYEDDSNDTPLMLATSETCRTLDVAGTPIQPGTRQHDQVVQLLEAAGASY